MTPTDQPTPELPAEVREAIQVASVYSVGADNMMPSDLRKLADDICAALAPLWAKHAQDTARLDVAEELLLSVSRLSAPDMSGIRFAGRCFNPAKALGKAGPSYIKWSGNTLRATIDAAMNEGIDPKETTK